MSQNNLDEKDFLLLKILKENSKLSTKEISKKLLMPLTTIHNRIKKLERINAIKNYTVNLNDKTLGTLSAFILVTVDYNLLKLRNTTQHELVKTIKANDLVEQTAMVTGSHDIIIKVRVKNIQELDNFVTTYLRNLHGIQKTQTMVILNEV
ncbi:Lrp/AsnC family transcriptional regulator [Candidatus Woesearchaeota archaeon]|nr:Lrp/AsnC family transcriptional regulator [Candidatus Woesearchaeota archaeon]